MRQYRGSSGDDRRTERRSQLIDAAIRVYGEIGYANASVRKVCNAAGLTERYFYESFANSDDLLAAAFDRIVERLYVAVAAPTIAAEGAGGDPLEAKLTAYFEALRANPASTRVFLIEIPAMGGEIDTLFGAAMDRFGEVLLQSSVIPSRGDQGRLLVRGVCGGLLHIARQWISEGYSVPLEDVVRAARQLCEALSLADAPGLPF